ncbi:MAG: ABC transporter substrate-binding protein [Chloroflexi bacterium]|nr:ABC transporter substrate-binding protein [Chloroflexota bacterium]
MNKFLSGQKLRNAGIAAIVVAVAVVAGCSSGTMNDEPGTAAATPGLDVIPIFVPTPTILSISPATAVPLPSPDATPEPTISAGSFRTATENPPVHFDVHQESSPALFVWGPGLVYDKLLVFDESIDGGNAYGGVRCSLCDSWAMLDQTTFEFNLDPDARWQRIDPVNGRPVTAADVVFSLNRQRTPGWPNASLLKNIDEIQAIGTRTVRITLKRPDPELFDTLADGHSVIVAPEVVAIYGDLLRGPNIGSGPWIWDETDESSTTLTANARYHDPLRPRISVLEIAYLSPGTQFTALLTGVIDAVQLPTAELETALNRNGSLKLTGVSRAGAGLEMGINTGSSIFSDRNIRRSLLKRLAIEDVRKDIWGTESVITVGLPITSKSWLLESSDLISLLEGPDLTPGEILAGSEIKLRVGLFDIRYVRFANRVAETLDNWGATTFVEEVTTRQFADEVWLGGEFDLFLGARPPVASLNDYLLSVYHSRGAWNTTGVNDSELDELIEQQAIELDAALRRELVLEIQRRIAADAYRFSPASTIAQWVAWPAIGGFNPTTPRMDNSFLSQVTLN